MIAQYLNNPTAIEGHLLLKKLKDSDPVGVISNVIEKFEDIPRVSKKVEDVLNKYNQICHIVMADCQPRG